MIATFIEQWRRNRTERREAAHAVEKAASDYARYLAKHGAAQRALAAKQLRDQRTSELRQCIANGKVANLGWRS